MAGIRTECHPASRVRSMLGHPAGRTWPRLWAHCPSRARTHCRTHTPMMGRPEGSRETQPWRERTGALGDPGRYSRSISLY